MGKKLAIKIDSREILILEGHYKKKKLIVEKYCSLKTPVGAIIEGKIIDSKELKTVISKGLKSNHIKAKNVSVLFTDNQVISRIITLPYVEKKADALSMIKYELDQILPIDVTSYSFVYNILKKFRDDDNVEQAEYFVNGSPTSLVDDYKELMKNVNLNLESINFSYLNLDSVSINSRVYKEDRFSENLVGFIDFGRDSTVFTTLNHGVQDFSRIIDNSSNKIILEISELFGKTEDEVKIIIKNLHMRDKSETDSNLTKTVRSKYEDLVNEIRRYVKYYATNTKEDLFIRMYVHGTSILPKDMYLYIQDVLGIECKKNFNISYVNADKVKDFDESLYFDHVMVLTRSKDTVNLLTIEELENKLKFNKTVVGIIVIIPTILIILLFVLMQKNYNDEIRTEINNMSSYIEKKEVTALLDQADVIEFQNIKYISEISDLDGAEKYLKNNNIVNTEYILDIARQMPVDTYISQITINKEGNGIVIYLQCTSELFTSIAQYENNLKKIGYYVSVNTTSISKGENYTYVLICTMKGETEDEY